MFVFPPSVNYMIMDKKFTSHLTTYSLPQSDGTTARNRGQRPTYSSDVHSQSSELYLDSQTSIHAASQASSPDQSEAEKENESLPTKGLSTAATTRSDNDWTNGVRFINRPHGTPLFTISEQRSSATLRTKTSNLTFTIRTRAASKPQHPQELGLEIHRTDRTRAASADDVALAHLRWIQSKLEAQDWQARNSSKSEERLSCFHIAPAQPPFPPLQRVQTPDRLKPIYPIRRPHRPRRPEDLRVMADYVVERL